MPKFVIEVYVCPVCGNYYGSSSTTQKLMNDVQLNKHSEPAFRRTRCPACWIANGAAVERVFCSMEVELVELDRELKAVE